MNILDRKRLMQAPLLALALVVAVGAWAAEAPEDEEQVFQLKLFGSEVGRMTVKEFTLEDEGEQREAISISMNMSLNRMGTTTGVGMEHLEVLDAQGNLARFRTELKTALMPQITEGRVEDGEAIITTNGHETRIPWDPETVGEKQMEEDYKNLIAGPIGGSVHHKVFVADLRRAVPTTSTLMGVEPRETVFGQKDLYKINTRMDIGSIVTTSSWVDAQADLFEQQVALGPISLQAIRINGEEPVPASTDLGPDLFETMILRPDEPLGNPRSIHKARYRLTFEDGESDSFFTDDQQKVVESGDGFVVLEVTSSRPENATALSAVQAPPDGEAFVRPGPLVQSDDPAIQAIAREVVGEEADAWKAAKALESWVYRNLTEKNLSVAFASAKETLERREGDCTEHATLLVALLRAAGLPARSAEGLIYARSINGFGYHMWSEVYLDGKWHDLDATRPAPMADATHIQMSSDGAGDAGMADAVMQMVKYMGQFSLQVEEAN